MTNINFENLNKINNVYVLSTCIKTLCTLQNYVCMLRITSLVPLTL